MNTRNGLIAAGVIAILAIIIVLIQSGNLSQAEGKMSAIQNTATAQQVALADQGTAAMATLSAASTQAADSQQKALSQAVSTAATAQANALNDAATSQANALNDAVNAASTMQARTLAAAYQAAATAQATAITAAGNNAATAQAKAVGEQRNAAATQLAQNASTLQAAATATLAAVVNAAASAQAAAVTDAQNTGATAQAEVISNAQATATIQAEIIKNAEVAATGTVGARLFQSTLEANDARATQNVLETQIAEVRSQLATAQATRIVSSVTPTANPTELATAVSPSSPTAEATEQVSVPADWKRFVGKGVAIQLPNTYVGNELGSDPQALAKLLRSLGPDFAAAAALFESNPDILALIAVNPGSGDANPAANVVIVSIPLPTPLSIETLLTATISQLPKSSTVQEKSVVELNGRKVGRMIVETRVGGLDSQQLQYYIIEHNIFYVIAFTGVPGHFDAQLPIFEQSMKTFEILPQPS